MSEQDQRPVGDEHALSGSYALDAVDADERARYEQALAGLRTAPRGGGRTRRHRGPAGVECPAGHAAARSEGRHHGAAVRPAAVAGRTEGESSAADAEVDAVRSPAPAPACRMPRSGRAPGAGCRSSGHPGRARGSHLPRRRFKRVLTHRRAGRGREPRPRSVAGSPPRRLHRRCRRGRGAHRSRGRRRELPRAERMGSSARPRQHLGRLRRPAGDGRGRRRRNRHAHLVRGARAARP